MDIFLKARNFFASKILKNSYVLNYLYNYYYLKKNKKKFFDEIYRRAQLSVFDYKELSVELPFCPLEYVKDTNLYGYADSIKKYTGLSMLNVSMEHGIYYDEKYIPLASYSKTIRKIVTMSEIRKCLNEEKVKKKTLAIGPYIHYATSILSKEEISKLKKKYGKILLFFPSHGSVEKKYSYEIDSLIKEINKIKDLYGFDTVFVNMYYYDILHTDYASKYEEVGFIVTTAGHRYDLNFLSRLKSIIELADATVSNAFGTNIGFSIYLNKPFIYLSEEGVFSNKTMISEVLNAFHAKKLTITEQQYSLVSKYWGFDSIKTPDQIRDFCN